MRLISTTFFLVIFLNSVPIRGQEASDSATEVTTITADQLMSGKVQVIGKLGKPLGKIVQFSGRWKHRPDPAGVTTKRGPYWTLEVDRIDGSKSRTAFTYDETDVKGNKPEPREGRITYLAYETLEWFGIHSNEYAQARPPGFLSRIVILQKLPSSQSSKQSDIDEDNVGLLESEMLAIASEVNDNHDIYLLDADGQRTRLTYHREYDGFPRWSPDGQKIAFISKRDGKINLYTMNPDGTNVQRITKFGGLNTSPAWSPDGKQIAFVSDNDPTKSKETNDVWVGGKLFVVDSDGQNLRRLQDGVGVYISWSPDGKSIAFIGKDHLSFLNIEDSSVTKVIDQKGTYMMPAWSPDGKTIAFASTIQDEPYDVSRVQIYTIARDGSQLRKLTDFPSQASSPAWSPDGNRIAFYLNTPDPKSDIGAISSLYIMFSDGSQITRLPKNESHNDYAPSFRPTQ